jgi:hypothetical protein
MEEPVAGFFATSPITLLIFAIAVIGIKQKFSKPAVFVAAIISAFGLLILFTEGFMLYATTMRYQMDFAPTILLGSIIGGIYFESQFKASPQKMLFKWSMACLFAFGISSHLAFGLTGIFDTLRRGEPKQYFALEDVFRPVSTILTPIFGSDQTRILEITIPSGSARFDDGTEGQWLGEEGYYMRFTAAQTIPMQFSADVVVRPDLPDGVKLEFQNPTGSSKSSVVKGISRQTFQFTLQPGSNRISIFANPNGPILKDQDKLRLAVLKNIQISPVAR